MIMCSNVTAQYNDFIAIDKVNISIGKNTSCAIIGKSGCGKTTLLHILAGLLVPTYGQIMIDGSPLIGVRKGTGIILQKDGLFPWKNVWENVSLGLQVRNIKPNIIKKEVQSILKELCILDQKDKYPNELSGGQRQRTAIARSIATNPSLLLMDEPTASLDAISKEEFQKQLLRLFKHHQLTMVFVTHDIEEAVFLAQKIIIMKEGKIKGEIKNPLFGNEAIKNDLKFYEMCLKVRRLLGGYDEQTI